MVGRRALLKRSRRHQSALISCLSEREYAPTDVGGYKVVSV